MNEINKFLAGLNETQKKLLVFALVLVVAALLDRLFIAPTMSHLSAIEDDIAKEKESIKQDLHFLGYKDRILKEAGEVDPYLTKTKVNDDDTIPSFNDKIQNFVIQSKITCKVNPPHGEQDTDYWKYQTDLDCNGNLADMISFMHLIDADKDLMKVVKFSFTGKKSDNDDIKATMTVEKAVVSDKPMPPMAQNVKAQ